MLAEVRVKADFWWWQLTTPSTRSQDRALSSNGKATDISVFCCQLAAEACALDRAQDYGNYLALVFSEMTDGSFIATHNQRPAYPVIPVTDSRSVWDSVHRMSTTFAEKRVEVDIAGLRESCRGLRWVPTEQQKADCLTKRSRTLCDEFRQFLVNPVVTLTDARAAEDMFTGQANAKWR